MNPTEARVATLRAMANWVDWKGDARDIRTAALAEIAAIEAEAKGADSPAPPPARPKRVRVTANCGYPYIDGKVYPVMSWSDRGVPRVFHENAKTKNDWYELNVTKWVPADEPEGEEAREREAFKAWWDSDKGPYANEMPTEWSSHHRTAYAAWLARAKVKP